MIIRKIQAVAVEVLLGLACVLTGVASMIPNRGLVHTLLVQSGYGIFLSLLMVGTGIAIVWAAVRTNRRLRVWAALSSNIVWTAIGGAYIVHAQYGVVLFLSVLFFAFTCLISLDGWE